MTDGRFGTVGDPPASLLIVGARVVDPTDSADSVHDIGVLDGVLVEPSDVPSGAERVEAHNLVLAPGFCDLHTHLRDPGHDGAETIASGSRAAARGGFTTVCAMPNTDPALDHPDQVALVRKRARSASCRVHPIAAVTVDRAGETLAHLEWLADAGAVAFSDDGASIATTALARAALERAGRLGRPLIEHAEDPASAAGGVMRAGPTAVRLGLRAWSTDAERSIVERDIALAAQVGGRVHFTHLSTAESLELVRDARDRGLGVTCDVTPHHMALTDAWVAGSRRFAWDEPSPFDGPVAGGAYDGSCRVNPPLGTRRDALALLAGIRDGVVDAIATDHAPHPPQRKLVPFDDAAPGLIGLETALSMGLLAIEAGELDLRTLMAALSVRPARIIGEPRGLGSGMTADLVLFDPSARTRLEASDLASASANTPLLGMDLPGRVRMTIADGRVTYRD